MMDPNLSDPPKNEDEEKNDLEEEIEPIERPAQLQVDQNAIRTQLAVVEGSVSAGQVAQATEMHLFGADIIDPRLITTDIPPDLQEAARQVQSTVQQSATNERSYNLNRWNVIIGGIGAFATTISGVFGIYAAMRQNCHCGPKQPAGVDTETISALINQWGALPDDSFWQMLAAYIDANKGRSTELTLGDQYQFMTYVIDLWPLAVPWNWSGSDLMAACDAFVSAYVSGGNDTAAMYRAVPGYTYQGSPLPRSVAATVLRFALAQLSAGASGTIKQSIGGRTRQHAA